MKERCFPDLHAPRLQCYVCDARGVSCRIRRGSQVYLLHSVLYGYISLRYLEGDRVILQTKDGLKTPLFTKPLRCGKTVHSQMGGISHQAIIGKEARDIVKTSTGRELRVLTPTLDDYVRLTPRLVTPVWFCMALKKTFAHQPIVDLSC